MAGSGSDPPHSGHCFWRENRHTPPLSVVRAEIIGPEDTIDAGQLRLRSRHGPEAVIMPSNVRWAASSMRMTN